ncbi:MAG: ATP-binding cassette domain-containing protein, partial [Ignavibacteriales bacterium]|nr:ATP-binding cassette domain-containing protein [Ignavibacteriales bacterium]
MEIFKTENLEKIYQENGVPVQALKNINLEINEGEYVVIAGPSGSGKTTLLNLLGALDSPTSGKIFFKNSELAKKSKKELSQFRLHNLGFVFQAYNLIPV